ncbi:unnamed protein product [Bursaphelenchus okinawaensis]|uniref:Aromatic-L-amino-acid decarboxylase n=1 Tax=Bursaphelenchus okinawaensis TaxID=465554 RepID=A0A811KQ64_9BILA|nr:unnamed protein product [Bursaphelenchus okinawaensis]CAG9107788.1 unnamed protein product [Bursaphelenchus okinawaensis]
MDPEEFRKHGKEMVDLIADYWKSIPSRKPMPECKPGFLADQIVDRAPESPESWTEIMKDIEPLVLANNTNWHHPLFFAYYPTACSYPAVMADMLSGAIASIGFTWKSSPSMTELEMKMMDWLVDALALPEHFKNSHPGNGAGCIQCTASDATLVAILAARSRAVTTLKLNETQLDKFSNSVKNFNIKSAINNILENKEPKDDIITFESHDPSYFTKFIGYCSDQSHSSVHKGFMLAGVRMRKVLSTRKNEMDNFCMDPEALKTAIKEDRARGFIPFIVVATMGTTSTCAVDFLTELGPICNKENIWLHVDAAYAGSFLLCPEFRWMSEGMEMVDSFNFNPHKAMMINFDCSPMWFKDATEAIKHFNVDAEYLKHEYQSVAHDYRHLQVALGRRFRSLKVWFVLRALGLEKIREYQRLQVKLAKQFHQLVSADDKFEVVVPPNLGLVCFRLKGQNSRSEALLNLLNHDNRIHLVPGKTNDVYYLRFAVCSQHTKENDITFAYNVISELGCQVE